jgi:hypothetical protein
MMWEKGAMVSVVAKQLRAPAKNNIQCKPAKYYELYTVLEICRVKRKR